MMARHSAPPSLLTVSPPTPAQASLGRVARGAVANLTGAAVMAVATFGVTMAATRGLPRAQAGVFFSTTSLFLLAVSVGQLGTDTGLVYFLSRSRTLGDNHRARRFFQIAMRPVLISAVCMAIAMWVLAPEIASATVPGHQQQATGYLRALALFIPFAGVENVALSATRGMGRMRANAIIEQLGRAPVQMMLVVAVVVLPATGLFVWAWAAAYAPAAVLAWLAWRRLRPADVEPVDDPDDARLGRDFWRFSVPRALTSVAQIAMQRFDIVLVGALSGASNAAIYAAATRFVVAGQMANNAVAQATQPRLAETLTRGDHAGTNDLYQHATAWLLLVSGPIYGVLLVFGRPLLHVFGRGYGAGSMVLVLISLSLVVSAACGMVDGVLSMAGHTSWNLANILLAFGVNLGLDLWLIPSHGVLGAAIGWATAIVIKNLAALSQVALALHLHPFGRASGTIGAIVLVCFGAIPLAARVVVGNSVIGLFVGLAAAAPVYLCMVWIFRRPLRLDSLRALRRRRRPMPTGEL